jgi:glycosyltransferase involved in cell wall biosynthesis
MNNVESEESLGYAATPVCLVTPLAAEDSEGNGVENYEGHSLYSRDLLSALRKKWMISVVANQMAGYAPGEPGVYRVWKPGFQYPFRMLKQVVKTRAKVVHFERLGPTVFGPYFTVPFVPFIALFLRLLHKRVLVSFSDVVDANKVDPAFLRAFQSWLHASALVRLGLTYFYFFTGKLANTIFTQTKNSQVTLEERYHVDNAKIKLVPLSGPALKNELTSEPAKKILGLDHKKVLLFFGHLAPYKGLEALVEAQAIVQRQRSDVTLIIAGGNHRRIRNDYLSRLRDLAREKEASVRFTGFLPAEEIPTVFSAADIVVYPCTSIPGSSGCVSLTKQYGKPLVTTKAVAKEEGIAHLLDAYVIPEATAELIAAAVLKLLGDDSLTGHLCTNIARTSVPIDLIADDISNTYQRLLA